jgi:hypothetical protein
VQAPVEFYFIFGCQHIVSPPTPTPTPTTTPPSEILPLPLQNESHGQQGILKHNCVCHTASKENYCSKIGVVIVMRCLS